MKALKEKQKETTELNNIIHGTKNSLDRNISRLDISEERVNELEDRPTEIMQTEVNNNNKMNRALTIWNLQGKERE